MIANGQVKIGVQSPDTHVELWRKGLLWLQQREQQIVGEQPYKDALKIGELCDCMEVPDSSQVCRRQSTTPTPLTSSP